MIREIPQHPKGFKNEWGAALELQSQIQQNLIYEEKQEKMKKQQYLKEQLEQQMQESQARAKQREAERYDPNERQRALNVAQQFEQEKRQRSLANKIKISHDLKETMEAKQFRIDMEQKMRGLEKQLISKSYQDLAQRDRMQQELDFQNFISIFYNKKMIN